MQLQPQLNNDIWTNFSLGKISNWNFSWWRNISTFLKVIIQKLSEAVLGTPGLKAENIGGALLKLLLTKLLFKLSVVFRQNSKASKLYSVGSDKSFVGFLYINELYIKKVFFTNRKKCFFSANVLYLKCCGL